MTRIVLVRHASTEATGQRYPGRSDPRLSADGRAEAEAMAARLIAGGIVTGIVGGTDLRLVTSPARRARETARAIAEAAAMDPTQIELDPRWDEADMGAAGDLTFDELAMAHPDVAARILAGDVAVDWPGGERAAASLQRVGAALAEVATLAERVIVVTHAGPIRAALALLDPRDPRVSAARPAASWVELEVPIGVIAKGPLLPSGR